MTPRAPWLAIAAAILTTATPHGARADEPYDFAASMMARDCRHCAARPRAHLRRGIGIDCHAWARWRGADRRHHHRGCHRGSDDVTADPLGPFVVQAHYHSRDAVLAQIQTCLRDGDAAVLEGCLRAVADWIKSLPEEDTP